MMDSFMKYMASSLPVMKESSMKVYRHHERAKRLGLPTSFDARNQWPSCIHSVRDQQGCGSCWAFSSAGMLEDRICIASKGAINVRLSP